MHYNEEGQVVMAVGWGSSSKDGYLLSVITKSSPISSSMSSSKSGGCPSNKVSELQI
jgi:hypothetical protein